MLTVAEQFKSLCETSSALVQARSAHQASTQRLFTSIGPILHQHKNDIGALFDEAGCSEIYEQRFGSISGNRLSSIGASATHLEVLVTDYFRGEQESYKFRLPRKYLNGDPSVQLAEDIAYYKGVFERLARRRTQREAAETRAENLQELARLAELYKNDPEALNTLSAATVSN